MDVVLVAGVAEAAAVVAYIRYPALSAVHYGRWV